MAQEIETKVLNVSKEKIIAQLTELGAKQVLNTRYVVDWFGIPDTLAGAEEWFMRIRTTSDGVSTLTWKAKSTITGNVRRQKEINFNVSEREKLADLFLELGYENYAHQEKDRTSFVLGTLNFDIDTYPGIPDFLEIEGVSEADVERAIVDLGLNSHDTWADGERTLIESYYQKDWYTMKF
jgi:adenylate cyclase, class 2